MYPKCNRKHLVAVSLMAGLMMLFFLDSRRRYHSLAMGYASTKIGTPYSTMDYQDEDVGFRKVVFVKTGNAKVGTEIVDERSSTDDKSVLILSTIGNSNSYGGGRTIKDLVDVMMSFEYNFESTTLAFSISDKDEFQAAYTFFSEYVLSQEIKLRPVSRIVLISAPFIDAEFLSINREDRHKDSVQRVRRRLIARSRNFVLLNALENEQYSLFIDADIERIEDSNMLRVFIETKKDIIVPRIIKGGNEDYDKNSWAGERTTPTSEQLSSMDVNDWENWDYVPMDVPEKMFHFQTFVDETRDVEETDIRKHPEHIVKLDSVGGAILFAKSIIYRQGILFPPINIIGTTWDRYEGYDGIETEGLCYLARPMGYTCWGMPNLVAYHNDS